MTHYPKIAIAGLLLLLPLVVSLPVVSQETAPSETAPAKSPDVKASLPEAEPKLPPKGSSASPTTGAEKPVVDKTAVAETAPTEKKPKTSEQRVLTPPSDNIPLMETPTTEIEEPVSPLESRISLDLREIDILDVLNFLAIKANLNVVGAKGITGSVTLLLNDVKIRDAIDIILSSNRLAYNIKENVMRVMSEEEYKALYGREFYDQRETKIVRLKYASPKNVGAMLENVKSTVGRVVYDDSTGTVVMTDTPEKIAAMEEVIRHEELPSVVRIPPTKTEIFDLQYAKAIVVSEKLTPTLTKDLGKSYVDERTNRLIVSDLPYKIEELREIVKALDTKTREVFIEAKIIHIQLNDQFQAGVDWASIALGHFQQTFPLNLTSYGQMQIGTIAPTTTTNADRTTSTTYSGSGIILKLLETFGKSNVVSTPQIATVDGEEAKIMVGTKEAYTTSSVTQSQATTTTAQSVTFVDVGVTLSVTPTINTNGFITMKIRPEVSAVNRFITTAQGDQIPIVESTSAETKVMVKDGATILIGGLMTTRRSKTRSGIPILSRIPIIGMAFRATDDRSANSELSVLLTPHIMSGEETFPGVRPPPVAQVTLPPEGGMPGATVLPDVTVPPAKTTANLEAADDSKEGMPKEEKVKKKKWKNRAPQR